MCTLEENRREGVAPALPPPAQLFLMSAGVVVSTALALAAELGIADGCVANFHLRPFAI